MICSFLMVGHNPPYAARMVRAVKEVLGCEVVQWTDLTTPQVDGVDRIERKERSEPLMPWRLKWLSEASAPELLHLDTDVIVQKSVREVWEKEFDVAMPHRDQQYMQYCTGVIFSRNPDFWRWARRFCLQVCKPKHWDWYGDQIAAEHVAKSGVFKVLGLDNARFNCGPTAPERKDATFVHYKGAEGKRLLSD